MWWKICPHSPYRNSRGQLANPSIAIWWEHILNLKGLSYDCLLFLELSIFVAVLLKYCKMVGLSMFMWKPSCSVSRGHPILSGKFTEGIGYLLQKCALIIYLPERCPMPSAIIRRNAIAIAVARRFRTYTWGLPHKSANGKLFVTPLVALEHKIQGQEATYIFINQERFFF